MFCMQIENESFFIGQWFFAYVSVFSIVLYVSKYKKKYAQTHLGSKAYDIKIG